jgi:hypothetical protein
MSTDARAVDRVRVVVGRGASGTVRIVDEDVLTGADSIGRDTFVVRVRELVRVGGTVDE